MKNVRSTLDMDLLQLLFLIIFLKERECLNSNIVHSINQASDEWGIRCLRYEIKDIHVPPRVKESMQMQVGRTQRNNKVSSSFLIPASDIIYFSLF